MANITFSQGSGLNDSVFGKSQYPIRRTIEKKAEAFEAQSLLPVLFHMTDSKNFGEKFTNMTAFGGFKPITEGGEVPVDGTQEGYSKWLEHQTWMDSFSITRAMIDDSKTLDLRKKPQGFVTGYYRTRERFGAALYAAAIKQQTSFVFEGETFDATCADKLALFHKQHPSILGKGKQSNLFADAFSADALGAVESEMQNFKGDAGEVLSVAPNTIVIANDYQLKKDVFAAIGADKDPNTANNGFNYQYGRWTVVIDPYLNPLLEKGLKPWIVLDQNYNEENDGAVWLDRTELEVTSEVERNRTNVWSGYARFIAGFNDWRFAAIGGIAGGTQLIGG